MSEPFLNQVERDSALWKKLQRYMEERRDTLRAKNDSDLDERKTARLRGRIVELKHLAALGDPAPLTEAIDPAD